MEPEEENEPDEVNVMSEEDEEDPDSLPETYDITSYGSDWDVDGVVKRMRRDTIFVPPFQRDYVWNINEASRFIESLLLGLPVPGVFVAKERDTNRLLLIDGQQRCKSLQFFYDGVFKPDENAIRQRVFKLRGVARRFEGRTYKQLEEPDRIMLDDSVIHATVVRQDSPADDDTSIFRIFERLNSGGRKLVPQEIRVAVYHGPLTDFLRELNEDKNWREIFGKPSARLKDQELVLRYLALLSEWESYRRPMKDFLNRFAKKWRQVEFEQRKEWDETWGQATELIWGALGRRAFRPTRALNAALFDAVMVGLGTALIRGVELSHDDVRERYETLLNDDGFVEKFSRSTADDAFVRARVSAAIAAFVE